MKVPKLIIINGAPAIGKSTVARSVFARLPNSAFLDGDDVWQINPFEVTDRTKAIVERNIPFVLRGYFEAGYDHVILAWVMHQQAIIDWLLQQLGDLELDVRVFTLTAEEATAQARWRERGGQQGTSQVVSDRLRQTLQLNTTMIDTTHLTPEEVAEAILADLQRGRRSPGGS